METITRKPYETDLTDEEWTILEPILKRALYGEKTKKGGLVGVVVGGVLCSVGLCVSCGEGFCGAGASLVGGT